MYKLLIADDEEWIRTGISQSIDWGKLGITSVDTTENGSEAVEKIKLDPPDLVISDVVMPKMTGIQLSEWISINHPEIKVILISGYDQFEYARNAIRYGVVDYILKPVEEEKLLEAVERCLRHMDSLRRKELETVRDQTGQENLRQLFYLKLLGGDPEERETYDAVQKYMLRIPLDEKHIYCNALADLQTASKEQKFSDWLQVYFNAYVPDDVSWEIVGNCGSTVAVLCSEDVDQDLEAMLTELLKPAMAECGAEACIMGNMSHGVRALRQNLVQVEKLYRNAFTLPSGAVCPAEQLHILQKGKREENRLAAAEFSKRFSVCSVLPDQEQTEAFLQQILSASPMIGKREMGKLLYGTLLEIMKELEASSRISPRDNEDSEMLGWVFSSDTLEQLRENLWGFVQRLTNIMGMQDECAHKRLIRGALEYIQENYAKDIALADIASHLHICKHYFSQLFGKEMGIGFAKYLMNYRLDKAKELLDTTNLRVYQISEMVGYPDVKYFLKLFKKNVGVSPQIYREKKNP